MTALSNLRAQTTGLVAQAQQDAGVSRTEVVREWLQPARPAHGRYWVDAQQPGAK